mmetsp:Transcript_17666/g.45423  ORF Transcript_17666/g.45423 Transcript_17666/m.45423 type:complete len:324 (+) Transcript_17666:1405-2376(+)
MQACVTSTHPRRHPALHSSPNACARSTPAASATSTSTAAFAIRTPQARSAAAGRSLLLGIANPPVTSGCGWSVAASRRNHAKALAIRTSDPEKIVGHRACRSSCIPGRWVSIRRRFKESRTVVWRTRSRRVTLPSFGSRGPSSSVTTFFSTCTEPSKCKNSRISQITFTACCPSAQTLASGTSPARMRLRVSRDRVTTTSSRASWACTHIRSLAEMEQVMVTFPAPPAFSDPSAILFAPTFAPGFSVDNSARCHSGRMIRDKYSQSPRARAVSCSVPTRTGNPSSALGAVLGAGANRSGARSKAPRCLAMGWSNKHCSMRVRI